MYEQYTDKQIVEMLKPKLAELGWGNVVNNDLYPDTCKMIATIYRSAYIRGQLGRSFIIGEPKQTGHWVPTTRGNVKKGDKVRYLNAKRYLTSLEFYPPQGAIGEVVFVCNDDTCIVQWPGYKNTWYTNRFDLEVWLCE